MNNAVVDIIPLLLGESRSAAGWKAPGFNSNDKQFGTELGINARRSIGILSSLEKRDISMELSFSRRGTRLAAVCCFALVLVGCGQAPSAKIDPSAEAGHQTKVPPVDDLPAVEVARGDWPWWRGPNRNNISDGSDVPLQWSEDENIIWKAPISGKGHSSPILCGDRIFLTTADDKNQEQSILCLDRQSGKELWKTVAHQGGLMVTHTDNSHASATPACDGKRVFVPFDNGDAIRVTATDLDGKILWQKEVGAFISEHGYASSPVIYKSWVFILCDFWGPSFLAALRRDTGEIVWRVDRPHVSNYGSPAVGQVAGREQLVVAGGGKTIAYNPATGEELWSCDGPTNTTGNTPALGKSLVYACGNSPEQKMLCISADGTGNVTSSKIVWETNKSVAYVPSSLLVDEKIYYLTNNGVATCYNAVDGHELWVKRLRGNFLSSPILVGNHFFVSNTSGRTYVFSIADPVGVVAENDLGEGNYASPVIIGGRIYLRTVDSLYCIGKPVAHTAERISEVKR